MSGDLFLNLAIIADVDILGIYYISMSFEV